MIQRRQQGFTLVLALVILIAMTLVIVSSVNMNVIDFKIAQNVESKELLKLSAEQGVEQVLNSVVGFSNPIEQTLTINGHTVSITSAKCISATAAEGYSAVAGMLPEDTNWSFTATAIDAVTGAVVEIHQGAKIKLLADSCP